MSAQTTPQKIIVSPEAAKAQQERVLAALAEKEKQISEQIDGILKEANCIIDCPVVISALSGIQPTGFRVIALERLQK